MINEQDKTLEGVQIGIQMEIDGKEYYLKASQESGNPLGKELLESLAAAEDTHRQKFVQIYDAIRSQKGWPIIIIPPGKNIALKTIFAQASERLSATLKVLSTELDAVKTAMDMENKTYDFYEKRGKDALHDTERGFYQALAVQEREHHRVLLDYYEYLKNPAGWFVKKEHPSLDGG